MTSRRLRWPITNVHKICVQFFFSSFRHFFYATVAAERHISRLCFSFTLLPTAKSFVSVAAMEDVPKRLEEMYANDVLEGKGDLGRFAMQIRGSVPTTLRTGNEQLDLEFIVMARTLQRIGRTADASTQLDV